VLFVNLHEIIKHIVIRFDFCLPGRKHRSGPNQVLKGHENIQYKTGIFFWSFFLTFLPALGQKLQLQGKVILTANPGTASFL
jgi:hypothetical protein